jgi:hypothetical protein
VRGDRRTEDRLKFHYEVEKRLADKLRRATSSEERVKLYPEVYNELFRRIPDHEQLQMKGDRKATEKEKARQFGILRWFIKPTDVYCEIGVGDCTLAVEVAKHVVKVYAIDVSENITSNSSFPTNLTLVLSDGISIPVREGTVNVAYSNQLMEHLHPEDAEKQISEIYRALSNDAKYICITPNRLSGPHDISRYFDRTATGLHLKEYTNGDLIRLFRRCGFRRMGIIVSWHAFVVPWLLPLWPFTSLEKILELLPPRIRRSVAIPIGAAKFVAIK